MVCNVVIDIKKYKIATCTKIHSRDNVSKLFVRLYKSVRQLMVHAAPLEISDALREREWPSTSS
jgi:ribosomal protein S8